MSKPQWTMIMNCYWEMEEDPVYDSDEDQNLAYDDEEDDDEPSEDVEMSGNNFVENQEQLK